MIERRAGGLGIANDVTVSTGKETIVLDLRGSRARTDLDALVQKGQLYFRPVLCGAPAYSPATPATGTAKATITPGAKKPTGTPYQVPPTCPSPYRYSAAADYVSGVWDPGPHTVDPAYAHYKTTPNTDDQKYEHENVIFPSGLPAGDSPARYVLGPSLANGTIIKRAYAVLGETGGWEVDFTVTRSGDVVFSEIAATCYHTLVANDLDGDIVSAPLIDSRSFSSGGQITGNFSSSSAHTLAVDLSYGALPLALIVVRTQTRGK